MRLSRLLSSLIALGSAGLFATTLPPTACAQAPATHNRISATADFNTRVAISGHVPTWAAGKASVLATDQGTVADTQQISLNFGLSRPADLQTAFDQLLQDQQNPNSPRYHQWLTPAQVGEQYGPTQHDLDLFSAWLTGQGFTVTSIAPSRIFVQATAPAAVVSAALQTSLHTYAMTVGGRAEVLQAPTSEPTLPAALSGLVSYVGGLASVPLHTFSHISTESRPIVTTNGTVHPDLTATNGAGAVVHYQTPLDFNKIYDVSASGMTGTGQKIMIIGGSRLFPQDITNWENLTAQAAYQPNYIVGPNFTDPGVTQNGDMGEGTLDFERAYGTAPGATIDMVIAKNWLDGTINANLIQYAISSVNDPVMSLSFGACENLQNPAYVRQEDSTYAVAESQGISVLVSSGDAGVAGCEAHGVAPPATQTASINDICATSHVTCVGGTQLNDTANPTAYWADKNGTGLASALSYIPEGAWNEPVNAGSNSATVPYVVAASGGGPSTVIAKPTYQAGSGVPADGVRDTPDISFSAASHDGYFSCLNYLGGSCIPDANKSISFIVFGGTSASAPSMAGVAALIDQKLGARQGNLNPALYKLAATTPAAFHDATVATSGVSGCSVSTPSACNNSDPAATSLQGGLAGYQLQTGYDLVTGLGSLDVSAYLTALATPTLTATTTTLTAAPTTTTTRQTVVFTAAVSGGSGAASPSSNVVFTSNGTTLATVSLTSGTASTPALSFPTAGTYTITATYVGDTSYATSNASIQFIVTAPVLPATTTTLTGTTGTITTQQTATYTATVTSATAGTITGQVTFNRVNYNTLQVVQLGTPVNVVNGSATLPPTVLPAGPYNIQARYSGDANYGPSPATNGVNLTVTPVAANAVLSSVPANVTSTTAINPVATVTSNTGSGTPSGTVQFLVDGKAVGTPAFSLTAGTVNGPAIYLPSGTHTLSALYAGDTVFASATSAGITVSSTLTATTTVLVSPPTTGFTNQTFTLTAQVSGVNSGVPPGQVSFYDGTTLLGTATAPVITTGTGGTMVETATFATGTFAAGPHSLTAVSFSNGSYSGSNSAASMLTISPVAITLAPASATLLATSGTAASDAIAVTYTGAALTETLTCTVTFTGTGTAPVPPTCSILPNPINFTGSGTANVALTISSVKGSAVGAGTQAEARRLRLSGLAGTALCGLLLFCLPSSLRRRMRGLRVLSALLLLAGSLGMALGCGGGSGGSFAGNGPIVAGTTKGTYNVVVTAAGNTPNAGATTTISLTVQ